MAKLRVVFSINKLIELSDKRFVDFTLPNGDDLRIRLADDYILTIKVSPPVINVDDSKFNVN